MHCVFLVPSKKVQFATYVKYKNENLNSARFRYYQRHFKTTRSTKSQNNLKQ